MAFTEKTAQRIREILLEKGADFSEKKMFSGICFMVNNKMCCGTHIDKATNGDFVLCRIGPEAYPDALQKEGVIPMEFTGRSMSGYVYATAPAIKTKKELSGWLQKCLDFNPHAKKSSKK